MKDYLSKKVYQEISNEQYSSELYSTCIYSKVQENQENQENQDLFFEVNIFQCEYENNNLSVAIILTDITQQILYWKKVDQEKTQMLASVSHDLRTPLNSIINNIQLSNLEFNDLISKNMMMIEQQEHSQESIQNIQKYNKMIDSNSKMLLLLVNDILDHTVSQVREITTNPEEFPLQEAVQEVIDLISLQAQKRNNKLKCNISQEIENITIKQDKLRIKQILMNLMGNSVKFTKSGVVELKVSRYRWQKNDIFSKNVKKNEQLLLFEVKDTGQGINEDQKKQLFNKFYSSKEANPTGIGLGLVISKSLVGVLGPSPDIEVSSQPGKGSTFSFILYMYLKNCRSESNIRSSKNIRLQVKSQENDNNLEEQESLNSFDSVDKEFLYTPDLINLVPQSLNSINGIYNNVQNGFQNKKIIKNTSAPVQNLSKLQILLVDDNPFNIQTLQSIIISTAKGYFKVSFEEAQNGKEAIDKILEQKANSINNDLVIIDYEMPVMNGAEAMKQLYEMSKNGIIQEQNVWLCTANGSQRDIDIDVLSKFQEVLVKPIDFKLMKKLLLDYFYNQKQQTSSSMKQSQKFTFSPKNRNGQQQQQAFSQFKTQSK